MTTQGRFAELGPAGIARRLREGGCFLDAGAAALRVRAAGGLARPLADALHRLYGAYPADAEGFADISVRMRPGAALRRWFGAQVDLVCDGRAPFDPFPADHALPLFEWGVNWLFAARTGDRLMLHAGVVARDGRALILPAAPGSGKSTLTAALMLRGWRLLSDEFGVLDPASGLMQPMPRPIALKNASIDVIAEWASNQAAEAVIGPRFPRTRKGTVAHLAPDPGSVAARFTPAAPALVLCPRYCEGLGQAALTALSRADVFSRLTVNAFNYHRLGGTGFTAAIRLAQQCPGFELAYGSLDQVVAFIDDLFLSSATRHDAAQYA